MPLGFLSQTEYSNPSSATVHGVIPDPCQFLTGVPVYYLHQVPPGNEQNTEAGEEYQSNPTENSEPGRRSSFDWHERTGDDAVVDVTEDRGENEGDCGCEVNHELHAVGNDSQQNQ